MKPYAQTKTGCTRRDNPWRRKRGSHREPMRVGERGSKKIARRGSRMRNLGPLMALLFLSACSHMTLRPINPNHWQRKQEVTKALGVQEAILDAVLKAEQSQCDKLDSEVMGWSASAIVVGVLGGGSGVSSVLTDSTPRYVTGITGVFLASWSALSAYLSTQYAQRYSRQCTVNTGGK